MRKWICVMVCLSLIAGMLTVDTTKAMTATQKGASEILECAMEEATIRIKGAMTETAVVESGDLSALQPGATPTATPTFGGNLTVEDPDVYGVEDGEEKDTCVITSYRGSTAATTIYIPAKINDKKVVAVTKDVFSTCYFLKNLVVKGDTEIEGTSAFHPESQVTIWGVANGKAAAFAAASGCEFRTLDTPAAWKVKKGKKFNKVLLSWEKTEGAVSYRIFRKKGKKEYKEVADVTTLQYTDLKRKPGDKYSYRIMPVFLASNGEMIEGNTSGKKVICLAPSKVRKARAKGIRGGIQVRWKRNKSVTGYQVYMKVHVKGFKTKFNLVKTLKTNKVTGYRCKMLVRGMKYSYRIRTFKKVNGKKVSGSFVKVTARAR